MNDAAAISAPAWLDRALYPFASHAFATAEGRMHYVDEGAGRPVLFVHGTPSWSFEWRAAITALKGQARCVAPDHLGFGLSDKPAAAAYRPAHHAGRLLALVRALDLREITLVLHDFGGPIGLPVLLEEPARVRALVVVNSWAWAHASDPKIARLSKLVASPIGRFLYLSLNASLWERREVLQRVPVTLVWGMRDPAFGASYLATWREALPHARVHELADVGHFPQEEAPEALNAALRAAIAG